MNIGGSGLLQKYGTSAANLLRSVYSSHNWLPWKFSIVSREFWNDKRNQKHFFECAGKELNIKEMDDWYNITAEENYMKIFF